MFEYLKAEAYTRLREEITLAIKAELNTEDAELAAFYAGRIAAYNRVLSIMNKVHKDLINDLDREAEKEAAYYESELSADESRSKQL